GTRTRRVRGAHFPHAAGRGTVWSSWSGSRVDSPYDEACMQRFHRSLIAAALALVAAGPARAEEARGTILHTTDLHGALTAWDYSRNQPASRGLVRLATLIRGARAEGVPTLLVDAGDAIEGGIETAYHMGPERRPDPMVAAMNALRYDAMTVGNHEFD